MKNVEERGKGLIYPPAARKKAFWITLLF